MNRYQRLKEQGLCPVCGKERDRQDRVLCGKCRESVRDRKRNATVYERKHNAEIERLRHKRYREMGMCTCGRPLKTGHSRCAICIKRQQDRYEGKKANGLCVNCGKKKEEDKHVLCAECRQKRREFMNAQICGGGRDEK